MYLFFSQKYFGDKAARFFFQISQNGKVMLLILAVVFPMDVPKVTESLPFRIILKIPIKWKWFGMLKIRIIKCLMFVCQNVPNIIFGFHVCITF